MSKWRGWIGEKKTAFYLWLFLPKKKYYRINNIILPSQSGTTQFDHIIISVYGLFIVETKNKKGWIFGSEKQPFWTQTIYGKKYSFQNPLRQTFRQKKILSEFLNISESKIFVVIYFVGDSTFKTPLPKNVIRSGLSRFIKRNRDQKFSIEEAEKITKTLQRHKSESSISNRMHVKNLRKRHNSKSTCPRCGSNLIKKTAKKGANAGSTFLGCENFPKCRFSKNM